MRQPCRRVRAAVWRRYTGSAPNMPCWTSSAKRRVNRQIPPALLSKWKAVLSLEQHRFAWGVLRRISRKTSMCLPPWTITARLPTAITDRRQISGTPAPPCAPDVGTSWPPLSRMAKNCKSRPGSAGWHAVAPQRATHRRKNFTNERGQEFYAVLARGRSWGAKRCAQQCADAGKSSVLRGGRRRELSGALVLFETARP